jgi:hypothetical protein
MADSLLNEFVYRVWGAAVVIEEIATRLKELRN